MSPSLTLELRPEWDELDQARASAAAFLEEHGLGRDVVDALTMVTSELLENAVKYGAASADHPLVSLRLALERDRIMVEVKNPLDMKHLARLDRMIRWIRSFEDPFEPYRLRLREVSGESLETRASGQGLVRIAYEGQSVLDYHVDERQVVTISATHQLRHPTGGDTE